MHETSLSRGVLNPSGVVRFYHRQRGLEIFVHPKRVLGLLRTHVPAAIVPMNVPTRVRCDFVTVRGAGRNILESRSRLNERRRKSCSQSDTTVVLWTELAGYHTVSADRNNISWRRWCVDGRNDTTRTCIWGACRPRSGLATDLMFLLAVIVDIVAVVDVVAVVHSVDGASSLQPSHEETRSIASWMTLLCRRRRADVNLKVAAVNRNHFELSCCVVRVVFRFVSFR